MSQLALQRSVVHSKLPLPDVMPLLSAASACKKALAEKMPCSLNCHCSLCKCLKCIVLSQLITSLAAITAFQFILYFVLPWVVY
ncbi:hypothetical protein ABN584_18710 [Gloeocapsa sp. BRSZ]